MVVLGHPSAVRIMSTVAAANTRSTEGVLDRNGGV